jgi:succinyl-diaminopimelate desuccinylase
MREAISGELVLAFAGDEESYGELGMEYLLKYHPKSIGDATITVDAGSPNILRFGEKGAIWMTVTAKSNSYHAAHTHLGTSAIEKLTDAMLDLRALRNYPVNAPPNVLAAIEEAASAIETTVDSGETDVLKSVTVNFTVIKGGHLSNVAPKDCKVSVDIRLPAGVRVAEVEREIEAILKKHQDVSAQYLVRDEANWSDPDTEIIQLLKLNGERCLGKTPLVSMRIGQSDSRLYRYRSIPTVVCGQTPHNMGGSDEYIDIAELHQLTEMLALSAYDYLSSEDVG